MVSIILSALVIECAFCTVFLSADLDTEGFGCARGAGLALADGVAEALISIVLLVLAVSLVEADRLMLADGVAVALIVSDAVLLWAINLSVLCV